MFNHRQVANNTPLEAGLANLASILGQGGYAPALFGYTDTPLDPRAPAPAGEMERFDWVCPGFKPVAPFLFSDGFAGWRAWLAAKGYALPDAPAHTFLPAGGLDSEDMTAPCLYRAEHSDTAWLAQAAIDYIAAQGDKPWFAHVCCLRPHPPAVAPEPYNRMYDPDDVPAPARPGIDRIRDQHPFAAWQIDSQRLTEYFRAPVPTDQVSEARDRAMRATYYGNCSEVDAQIGRLIAHLKSSGHYDQTLIIFCADHGEQFGDNWLYGRRGYFDGHFHVPCIIRDPRPEARAARGRIVEQFTESVDLLPTILDVLGVEAADSFDGRSLTPFLGAATPEDWRRETFFELDFRDPERGRAEAALGLESDQCALAVIRGRRWKYVHFAALPPVLFDLAEDPGETRNLAADSGHDHIVQDCARRMLSWRMGHERPALTAYHQPYGGPVERLPPSP
jgi:arylsulfatase A-like enzyme